MRQTLDPQHRVVNPLKAIRMEAYRLGHNIFDFFDHHTELAAMAPLVAIFRTVVEKIEAKTERMIANTGDVFFDA
jgi:hypothetical protein